MQAGQHLGGLVGHHFDRLAVDLPKVNVGRLKSNAVLVEHPLGTATPSTPHTCKTQHTQWTEDLDNSN